MYGDEFSLEEFGNSLLIGSTIGGLQGGIRSLRLGRGNI